MFVLLDSQFKKGLQRQSALLLSSLRWLANVTPFSIDNIRTKINENQPQELLESEFKAYLSEIFNLALDYTKLEEEEIAKLNELRFYIDPPIKISYCGTEEPNSDNTEKGFFKRDSSTGNQYEARITCLPSVSCDLKKIKLTITPKEDAPESVGSDITLSSLGCLGGKQVFTKLWLDFVGDPKGHSYNLIYDFINEFGNSITTIEDSVTF